MHIFAYGRWETPPEYDFVWLRLNAYFDVSVNKCGRLLNIFFCDFSSKLIELVSSIVNLQIISFLTQNFFLRRLKISCTFSYFVWLSKYDRKSEISCCETLGTIIYIIPYTYEFQKIQKDCAQSNSPENIISLPKFCFRVFIS